uniref:Aldose 1-epimerase n=1 Tax=Aegilops tauschii TaxID=37682 RepID=N1QQQ1_AEGTA
MRRAGRRTPGASGRRKGGFPALGLSGRADAAAETKTVGVYELKKGDFSIKVTNWGATLMSVILPDSRGNLGDVILGYDTVAEYVNGTAYFGGLIGRVANRIANARFTLDGKAYRLVPNDGNNTLHGFPGDVDVHVKYQLSGPHELSVRMNATARGKATPVNLAHHAYWNLGGHGSGSVLGEEVRLFASRYTPVDAALIPTGHLAPVAGTPYDFRTPAAVGSRIGGLLSRGVNGYDINYVVDGGGLRPVAVVRDGASGRAMELWADQPGVQFYTANGLSGVRGKGGKVYGRYGALCLETQGFPDAVNRPSFPSQIVRPGKVYMHHMVFKFSF